MQHRQLANFLFVNGVYRAKLTTVGVGSVEIQVPETSYLKAKALLSFIMPCNIQWSVEHLPNPLRLKKYTYDFDGYVFNKKELHVKRYI